MPFSFSDLQLEVSRRSTKNQGGTQFTQGIKNVINTSMWRIARDAKWRSLRRTTTFNTIASYSTGSGNAHLTGGTSQVTVTGGDFLQNNINIGRYVTFSGSNKYFKITSIDSDTSLFIDQDYDGATTTTGTYSILGQEEYVLPIEIDHRSFFWHRGYGWPRQMRYIPTQQFYEAGVIDTLQNIPINYRMWGMNSNLTEVKSATVVNVSSSSSSDTNIAVTVFGTVSGCPDYEIITTNSTNGTITVAGIKNFTAIDRVVKNQNTVGRITATSILGQYDIAVLPVGSTTTGPKYTKIQLYPLPNIAFPITCMYYKIPYQLINDGDVPEIGEEFSEAIILLSVAKLKAEQNMKEDADFFKLYEDEMVSLKSTNTDKIDWAPHLLRPNQSEGGWWDGRGLRYEQVGFGGNYGPQRGNY